MTAVFSLDRLAVEAAVRVALVEDLGRAGDITSQATIPPQVTANAAIFARKPGVLAGLDLARSAFQQMDPALRFEAKLHDGDALRSGSEIAVIIGPARGLLGAERVALNYLGPLSGIATLTQHYAARIAHTGAKVCCTRKTTPGLRAFQKYAVHCGGGSNHRFGLDDAILIKDNHIAVAGGIIPALRAAKAAVGHLVKIEIEVDTLAQLDEVLAEGADVVLLDNMQTDQLREAVKRIAGKMVTEASGGVTLENIAAIAETGVDLISVGALTHSAPNLDLGLDIRVR